MLGLPFQRQRKFSNKSSLSVVAIMSDTWPLQGSPFQFVDNPLVINSIKSYQWIVVLGGILAFAMAWGIGANDVANAFATSVGAGSITLPMACVIAAVMEFAGALLLGGSVTDTVRKKVIKVSIFDPNSSDGAANGPEMLLTGFFIALLAATIWLILATALSLPVSTTHSIIGALIGIGLAYGGGDAVEWITDGGGLDSLKGVVGVIISWVVSPVLSGIIAVFFFLLVRTTVLRREESFKAGLVFMPFFYGITVAIAIFFIIYKGDGRFDISDKLGDGGAAGVAFGAGAVIAVFSAIVIIPLAKKAIGRWEERRLEREKNPAASKEENKLNGVTKALRKVGVNLEIDEELSEDVIRMHDNVEKFDPKTERLFTWIQVFTAAIDSFAHGANDVANAIAPFASIYDLYNRQGIISEPVTESETFESSGDYSGGGGSYLEGDEVPNAEPFCGEIGGTRYIRCAESPVYPYSQVGSGAEPASSFNFYDSNGDPLEEEVVGNCYTQCNPRNALEYEDIKQPVKIWILALGGAGIVLGLAMWGYRIILAIGVKLTKLTPSRGFSIEIGAAITVLIASEIGLPVSTTHCQVGATMGVGLVEGKASTVNWKQFLAICVGWVFTLVFTGFVSAILYLIVTNSPENHGTGTSLADIDYCPANRIFVFRNEPEAGFSGILCS